MLVSENSPYRSSMVKESVLFPEIIKSVNNIGGNLRGILLMFVATICFSLMHALIRYMAGELHPFQLAFFRNAFGLLVVLPWFIRYGLAPLKTQRLGLHAFRSCINVIAMLMFFYAVPCLFLFFPDIRKILNMLIKER